LLYHIQVARAIRAQMPSTLQVRTTSYVRHRPRLRAVAGVDSELYDIEVHL
jgi:hypothetical protein